MVGLSGLLGCNSGSGDTEKTLEKKDRVENCSHHHMELLTLVDQRNKREAHQNGYATLWS